MLCIILCSVRLAGSLSSAWSSSHSVSVSQLFAALLVFLLDYSDVSILIHQFPSCFNTTFLLLTHIGSVPFSCCPLCTDRFHFFFLCVCALPPPAFYVGFGDQTWIVCLVLSYTESSPWPPLLFLFCPFHSLSTNTLVSVIVFSVSSSPFVTLYTFCLFAEMILKLYPFVHWGTFMVAALKALYLSVLYLHIQSRLILVHGFEIQHPNSSVQILVREGPWAKPCCGGYTQVYVCLYLFFSHWTLS